MKMITALNNLEYRELNAANGILVVMLDSQGRIIFFNKACEHATAYTFKEVVNRKFWEFLASAEEAEPLKQGLQDFDAERFPHKLTNHLVTKTGGQRLIMWTDNVLLNREEKADRVVFYGRDITDSGDGDKEEAAQQVLPQLLANAGFSRHCFWITNSSGKILDVSDSYCALTGYTRTELLKMTIADIDANLKPEDVKARIQKVMKEGSKYFSSNHKCRGGGCIDLQVLANYTEAFGGLIFFTTTSRPDEREREPQAVKFSEQKSIIKAKMLDYSNDAIFIHDFNGNFTFINKTAYVKLGYGKEELMDMNMADFTAPHDAEYMEQHIKKLIDEGNVCYRGDFVGKNGASLRVEVKSQVMDFGNKKLILTVAQDITEIEGLRKERQPGVEKINQLIDDTQAKLAAAEGLAQNIAEQKRLEAELNRQKEILAIVEQNAGIGFSIISKEYKVTWANDIVKQTFGNIEDQFCYAAFKRGRQVCPGCEVERIFQSGPDQVTCRQTLTDKDGKTMDYKTVYSATKNENAETVSVFQALIPVNEVKADGDSAAGVTDVKAAGDSAEEINGQLANGLAILEQSRSEIALTGKMGIFLQSCINMPEANRVITQFLPLLFPSVDGALYLLNNSTDMYDLASGWGKTVESDETFAPDACLAVRHRKIHQFNCAENEEPCSHCAKAMKRGYIDVPMISQGKILGVFHLEQKDEAELDAGGDMLTELGANLAAIVAGQLAFALSSIRLQEAVREQATRDTLTGLYNRRYMEQALDKEIRLAARNKVTVGVITLDLDSFGKFNDRHGYKSGDKVMRNLADFLKSNSHPGDIICRGNGDEFALICPRIAPDTLKQRAEGIREGLANFNKRHQDLYQEPLTLSLGIAIFPENGNTSEQIIKLADMALNQAEQAGGNRIVSAENKPAK
jgi:diguanylate cyclase (GGDEF)-like protein/PAS domain S-box-containing protein